MAKRHSYLDGVEAGAFFREASDLAKVHEQLTTTYKSHNEEDLLLCLEDITHSNKERMISLQQDIFLQSSRLDLVILNNDIFSERLHSIDII